MKRTVVAVLGGWLGLMAISLPMAAAPVTITNAVDGAGMILGTGTYDERALVTLRAVPQVDWKFDHWEGLPADLATNNPVTVEAVLAFQPEAVFAAAPGNGRFKGATVVAWGRNDLGQTEVAGLSGVMEVAVGFNHSLALKADGTVAGSGQTEPPPGLSGVVAIAAGHEHSLALRADGTVVAWGFINDAGQVDVPAGLSGVVAIAAGRGHSLALKADGTVAAWGRNDLGQTDVAGLGGVVAIAAGRDHNLALKADGTVAAWGWNNGGQTDVPAGLGGVVAIAAGSYHSLALKADGTVVAWGWNDVGQTSIPAGLSGVVAIAGGGGHSLALKADETVVAWGTNGDGQTNVPPGLSGVVALAAGSRSRHCLALKADVLSVIQEPSRFIVAEVGSALTLRAGIATGSGNQWYLNGRLIAGQTSPWLRLTSARLSDSGSFQLLAQNATETLLTAPIEVRVLPVGYPRVLANGAEILTSTRQGDSAEVRLTTTLPNGQIFYTLDGSEPSLESRPYSGPFVVTNTVVVRAFAISGDFTQEATNDPVSIQIVPTFALSTAVTGNGRINRSPSLDRYLQDDVVTVTAVADTGWRFVRWEGDLSGSFPERNVAMGRNKTVRAVFEAIPRYPLATLARGGSATGAGTYYQGTTVNLAATPTTGWTFLGWTGDHVGTETDFSWAVGGPATFEARFGTTVSTLATGGGRIVLEPELAVYPYGTQVKVIPLPDAGNSLSLWGEAGGGQPKTEWVLTVTNATPRVTALFRALAVDKVVLTAQSTLGGHIAQPNADGVYARGSVVTLTAVAEAGHEFAGWSGDASGTAGAVTLTLDTGKTVRAEFRRLGVASHPLTVTVTGPGTVRRMPDLGAYELGSEVELVAEPAANAVFGEWAGAVSSTQRRIRLTIGGPTTVTARFLEMHPVATEVRGEGQVLLSPPEGRYPAGTEIAATAKAADGWGFVQWSGDLASTAQEAAVVVLGPTRLIAEFARLGTLTTRAQGQGTIGRNPEAASYLPGTAVTLTAKAAPGWRFVGWSGGGTGTNATLGVTVGRTEAIVAEFVDAEAPAITVAEPMAGPVTDERFALRGRITDNVGVGHASWQWNGLPWGNLTLTDGNFAVTGLELRPGTNTLTVSALDAADNLGQTTRTVVWNPVRTLIVGGAAEVQEGQRLVYPLSLDAPGDVAGLRFRLTYNPAYLADPQIEWGALVGQSVNTLNLAVPGEIVGTFALAGIALPAGSNRVATVSFRARSVAGTTNVLLQPAFVNAANAAGDALTRGNGAIGGEGRIKPRRLKGDNNANQRLDIGDAVVVSRLQVGLEAVRSWDIGLNDLNASGDLDSGDVIRVLRAVVGLDPQPTPSGEVARSGLARQQSPLPLANTNDVVTLEFPDGPVAALGQPWRVVVRLVKTKHPPSGLSFTLRYPTGLTLGEKQVGALIPAGALPLWGEVPGGLTLAAVSPDTWPASTGVAAVMTFTANAGLAVQAEWPVTLAPVELTVNGFDIRALDDVAGVVRSASVPAEPPVITLPPPGADGKLVLEVSAGAGQEVIVETTTDLNAWTESQRVTGQGTGTPVRVTITPQAGVEARFWRVRRP